VKQGPARRPSTRHTIVASGLSASSVCWFRARSWLAGGVFTTSIEA